MRIYVHTTANREIVPYAYQQKLVGVFHKWLGRNEMHDEMSLYSLSWLSHGRSNKRGLDFSQGANFFISAPGALLIKKQLDGMLDEPELFCGMSVKEISLCPTPQFSNREVFFVQSPVLIKRSEKGEVKFYYFNDPKSDQLLTETMKNKLRRAGMGSLDVSLSFDRTYSGGKTKAATFNGIKNKGSLNPVVVEGDPAAVAFCWETGLGNCTGIGFGAVK